MTATPSDRSLHLAERAPSKVKSVDPGTLTEWIAETEDRIAAKVASRRDPAIYERHLKKVINEQQTGGYTDGDGETRRMHRRAQPARERPSAAEEGWRLERQLERGARITPPPAVQPSLFDDAARARVVAMNRAGASYETIERAFRGYRGLPKRRALEQLVHRARQ